MGSCRVCREVVCKAIQIDKATCRRMIDYYITKLPSTTTYLVTRLLKSTARKQKPDRHDSKRKTLNDAKRTPNGSGMFLPIP